MKKYALLLLVICFGLLYGVAGSETAQSLNQAFQISSKSASGMDIRFEMPQYSLSEETIGNKTYQHIVLPGAAYTIEQGMPELPIIGTSIIVPARGSVSVTPQSVRSVSLGAFTPYPVQESVDLESPKSFVVNEDYFNGGGVFPANTIEYGQPVVMRDFRIVNIQISPFFYNSVTGELNLRESIDFRVDFTAEQGVNELISEPTEISAAFDKMYSMALLNYNDYRNLIPVNSPVRYLLLYGNNTEPAFVQALDDYVLWKRQKGADVRVVSTSTAGTSTTAIKTYLQNLYNDPTTRPDFIILLGDTAGSYAIPAFTESSGGGDYPYTHLAGADGVGDVFIGRISVENISQLQVVLNKIYLVEKNLNIATASWLNKMLLAADWTPSGISTVYMAKYLMEASQQINPDMTYIEVYGADGLSSGINSGLNQGVGFFNFRGYIDLAGWSPSESLINGFKLPHTSIITCGTGNYNGGLAKTETFIRVGTVAAPKGAVTSIGMSTSSTHTTFNNAINGGIIHGIYQAGMRTMGEALLAGKFNMHQIFGVSSPSNVVKFNHWANLMGDPTMEIFTGIPSQFTVTVDTSIPLGLSLLDVSVADTAGVVVGASVTLSQGMQVISRGFTDEEGNVILVLPAGMTAGNAVITVSKHNYLPNQTTITVVEETTLVPGAVLLDDDNFGASQGNNNSIANAGETIEVSFGLQNTGTTAINGISGYITTTSPYVTIADSTVVYGNIAGGSLGTSTNPVVMNISNSAPHGTMLRLHLILTDNLGGTYDVSEFIPVESAKFNFSTVAILDGGNNSLDPNETAPLTVGIQNIGPMGITGLYGRLYTLNDLVTISDNIGFFGDIASGATATTGTDNFTVFAREQILPGMVIPMRVKLYTDAGYEQFIDFSITIGVVGVQDPLGPDAYGYVIYDDGDWSYEHHPTFEWVGIAPAEGGLGTLLPLADAYTSGDEGDQVGCTSIVPVTLPFPFQFYGIVYNQISVSSNGFIALGNSANGEFRNYRLPGPMGPSPMIAPFWDDLATHTGGGVYTWYDRNNNAFIVEWYNMKNGKNGTSLETFQVILYDQAVYSTSLGDGPIKIQYQTFNNVDSQSGANHGNFASIGIEDHTGTRGLEYSFNNVYPVAASPLGNQRAIYITNVPVYHVEAQLILAQTFITDGNGNNIAEPGETVQLGIQLSNIGNAPANGISSVLTTTDEFINITQGDSEYYPLQAEGLGVNRDAFVFEVAEDCPDGHVAEFVLTVVSGENQWVRPFSIRIDASQLSLQSYLINDEGTGYNGVIDIGETVKLVLNVKNPTAVEAMDVAGTLSSTFPGVSITNPTITVGSIKGSWVMQYVYNLQFTGETGSGTYIPMSLSLASSNALPYETEFYIPYNIPNEFSDFEHNNADFESEIGWTWGDPAQVNAFSGEKVWATNLSGSYPDYVDYKLYTPAYLLTTQSQLTFKHYYATEAGFDGGNLSISTNGGDTWNILTPQSGYPHNNIAGLQGQAGFSGNSSGWQTASFDLGAYNGQNVMFRFRFGADGATSNLGWFIDDFQLSGLDKKTGKLYGTVIPTSEYNPALATVVCSNKYAAHPSADGSFAVYLKRGTYFSEASMFNHQSSTFGPFTLDAASLARYTEFTLIYLPKPMTPTFTISNETGELVINWTEPYDPVLPVMGYNVYKRFDNGIFAKVFETTGTTYTETITLDGLYQYYIKAKYINIEGSPSDLVSFRFPYDPSDGEEQIPGLVTALRGNYPNPFNPTTTISFDLASAGFTSLKIYNIRGQLVRNLFSGDKAAGRHHLNWDGRDEANRSVSSGVYFYRLDTKGYSRTNKMLLMK
ncbi:MAG: gingipain R [Candidatus Cloacimonetes bacterium HGW-Cloacimonetes-2]|jgi:hypothetical protein|nr:MAG: gingipain R [Candidatus Cloacimonetes bacterium HGW-Cloacimonetes-2]